MKTNRNSGLQQVRPPDHLIYTWWKQAIEGVKLLGWKVRVLRKGEAIYTTDKGRVRTIALKEYASGFWRLSVDFLQLFDGRSRFFQPCRPDGASWQGEFTCTAAEVRQVCERLPAWLKAYDEGEKGPLLPDMKPWIGYTWTGTAWKEYNHRNTPEALDAAITQCDNEFRGVVNSRTVANILDTDPQKTLDRTEAYMKDRQDWERVKPNLWRRIYSDAWILQILRKIGRDGMCDTPGILVETWHGYDRKEHEKLEEYMQGMKARGLVWIEQNLWWRAV
jgi:hypothetical protein